MVATTIDSERVTKWVEGVLKDVRSRTVEVIASYEELDEDSELVLVDGIELTRYLANPIVLYQHDRLAPVAEARNVRRTTVDGTRALLASVYFPEGDEDSERAYQKVKSGLVRGVSIGFRSLEQGPPRLPGQRGVTHLRTRLLEISLVTLQSCPRCLVSKSLCACATTRKETPMWKPSDIVLILADPPPRSREARRTDEAFRQREADECRETRVRLRRTVQVNAAPFARRVLVPDPELPWDLQWLPVPDVR